ncbi:MAG: glycosyltransferase family 8 protein [Alkalilacustris sp.]
MLGARLTSASRGARHPDAVVLCADQAYAPYATCAAQAIEATNPARAFDIVLCSPGPLELPPTLGGLDLRLCCVDVGAAFDGLPVRERFSSVAYLRFALAEVLGADYRRILYIDCDVLAHRDGLGAAFGLDLQGHPLGAVRDAIQWQRPDRRTGDQIAMGQPARPYFNSGALLMDSARFAAADVFHRAVALWRAHDFVRVFQDQTMLNLALHDDWAELPPVWNWQVPHLDPPGGAARRLTHFIGPAKPWYDPRDKVPEPYRRVYRDFLGRHWPETLAANRAREAAFWAGRGGGLARGLRNGASRLVTAAKAPRHRARIRAYVAGFRDDHDVKPR